MLWIIMPQNKSEGLRRETTRAAEGDTRRTTAQLSFTFLPKIKQPFRTMVLHCCTMIHVRAAARDRRRRRHVIEIDASNFHHPAHRT
ncbi:hypothetical protein EVAR_78963_1 [Eumeta japonica]|uniref:Uncharacterized protein n=1 Tax=Eumeta variegata TaxID=151549 RepID=A0A4C1USG9_EUMVA|nr:hypothetical protein EVAR_78963_1 [Eumeta japonica]